MPEPSTIRSMFASIAPRYDLANTILSFGLHHLWRRKAIRLAEVGPGDRVLDCATGTGDLALGFKRAVGPSGQVVGIDFCQPMLELAQAKAARKRLELELYQADALALPFKDDGFDCASIAFGIRSIDDRVGCLREMARVVRSGGRVVVLEFGQPQGRLFGPLYRWYSEQIMPRLGGWLSGDREAYRYLPETAAAFPSGELFTTLMEEAGTFASIASWCLAKGVTWIYIGIVEK